MQQATTSIRYEGIARALSPISHQGDATGGTGTVFHREKRLVDGKVLRIPTITGNSFRGILRDAGMLFMFRELGHPELTVEAFHFLTSGGALSKSGRGIDVAEQRRLTEIIPLAGVLGGACKNNIIPGKLHMGIWLPLCKETRSFLPDAIQDMPETALSMYDLMDEQSYSRMDDTKDVRKHRYLPEPQRELLMAPKTKTAKDGTEIAEKPGVAQQMRYSQEVMIAGTTFYVWMQLNDVTEMEQAAFASALFEWSKSPVIGGRGSIGCGVIEIDLDSWMEVKPLARMRSDDDTIDMKPADAYLEHLRTRKDEIMATLREVS